MAEMNYIDQVATKIADKCGMDMGHTSDRRLLRIYALLALTVGVAVTPRDVHDAWAVWSLDYEPGHKSCRPFEELRKEIRDLDEPYRQAIIEVAQEMEIRLEDA